MFVASTVAFTTVLAPSSSVAVRVTTVRPSSEGEKVQRSEELPSSHTTPDHENSTSSPAGETVSLS